jgi:DNA-binding winged helix-turn-helix (wHTH) protein
LRYLFDDYALDADLRELHRGQVAVPVAPQVFDLIEYLIRERNRVVSKDELIDAVWSGRIVSEAAITTRLNVARSVLGDSGDEQRLIKTVPRKGFRFVGAVQEIHRPAATSALPVGHPVATSAPPSLPRLSIVVLPFSNLSGDPEQEHFVDGVTESLTTDLSRISGSFVIGRHTAFTCKGRAVDLKQIGRDLNVRYRPPVG